VLPTLVPWTQHSCRYSSSENDTRKKKEQNKIVRRNGVSWDCWGGVLSVIEKVSLFDIHYYVDYGLCSNLDKCVHAYFFDSDHPSANKSQYLRMIAIDKPGPDLKKVNKTLVSCTFHPSGRNVEVKCGSAY